jgi:predicted ABC-type ATPase
VFVNADLIAAGLSPFRPEVASVRAGRLMLREIAVKALAGESFAFETTLSGRGYARQIPRWQASGYWVEIFFLSLDSVEMAMDRVKARVVQGGHDIPESVIRRRFAAGLANFRRVYAPLVNGWKLYDNSGPKPVLLEWGEKA